eukprot:293273-Pelagomonas_calceolata.AAC.1
MLDENVPPAADQPDFRAVGQPLVTLEKNWFQSLMLDENVPPAADQPDSWAVGQTLAPFATAKLPLWAEQSNHLAVGPSFTGHFGDKRGRPDHVLLSPALLKI